MNRGEAERKEALTLFTWGYWGWGNATAQFVEAADAAETARGFAPPVFVDIRIQRTGRAEGFKGDNFAKVVGPDRYHWMKSLGNRSVATKSGPRVQIDKPEAAEELLDLAVQLEKHNQRVLFYCACEHIRWDGKVTCHRDAVADLVLEAARRRGTSIRIVEWPGGEPTEFGMEMDSAKEWKSLLAGRQTIVLGDEVDLGDFGATSWFSRATLTWEDQWGEVFVGPLRYQKTWVLPILEWLDEEADGEQQASNYREMIGVEPRDS